MANCRQYGHELHVVRENDTHLKEKCRLCGYSKIYRKRDSQYRHEWNEHHQRDMIQPFQKEAWDNTWGEKQKVIRSAEQAARERDPEFQKYAKKSSERS